MLVRLGALHIAGASLGGLTTAAILGCFGALISADRYWAPVVLAAAVWAAWLGRSPLRSCGLNKQVTRRWEDRIRPGPLYFIWGALLGTGTATTVTRTGFLVVTASWLTAGPLPAIAAGALYGAVRQGVSVALAASGTSMTVLGELPARLFVPTHRANLVFIAVSGAATSTVMIA